MNTTMTFVAAACVAAILLLPWALYWREHLRLRVTEHRLRKIQRMLYRRAEQIVQENDIPDRLLEAVKR